MSINRISPSYGGIIRPRGIVVPNKRIIQPNFTPRKIVDVTPVKKSGKVSFPKIYNPFKPGESDGDAVSKWLNITKFSEQEDKAEVVYPGHQYINMLIQYPNEELKKVGYEIVNPDDSDDEKMFKILMKVQDALKYLSDMEHWGFSEVWSLPTVTLADMLADCEDGAGLIVSLGLNVGVNPDRLRFYAGLVDAGENAPAGGHGWATYRRESDNQWIVLDWCYYPNKLKIEDRTPMKDDTKYIKSLFFMTRDVMVETRKTNRVRNPDGENPGVYTNKMVLIPGLLPNNNDWVNIIV